MSWSQMCTRIEVVATLVACLSGAFAPAQATETWTVRPNAPAVTGAAMAYDSARQEVVLVGSGLSGFETWIWNGTAWSLRTPATRPSARSGSGVAYDGSRQQIVLFGGAAGSTTFADTWIWDGVNWVQQQPSFSPNAGSSASSSVGASQAMAYDAARARVVLFNASQICEWNGAGWVDVTPPSYVAAYLVFGPAVFDPLTQKVLLSRFLPPANSGSLPAGDFSWDGQQFTQVQASSTFLWPVAVNGSTGRVTRFTNQLLVSYATWEYVAPIWPTVNLANWTCCLQGSFIPRCLAFDAARNQLVVYGTHGAGPFFATQGVGPVPATASTTGASCGPAGLQLVPDPAARPLLGATARCRITGAPTPVFALTFGFSTQFYGPFPLPLPLDGSGMTGCILRHSADILGVAVTPVGADLEYALAVPATTQLLGVPVYLHGYGYAPGANPAQIALTNRLDWIVGNQ